MQIQVKGLADCQTAAEVRALAKRQYAKHRRMLEGPKRIVIPINDLTPDSVRIEVRREFETVQAAGTISYPSIASIIDLVCQTYNVTKIDLVAQRRTKEIVLPRQLAQALAVRLTPYSYPHIAKHFGGRDHTTIMYTKKKIEKRRAQDSKFDALVTDLENRLGGYNPDIKQYGEHRLWTEAQDTRLKELIATTKNWRSITNIMNREFNLNLAHSACYGRMYTLGLRRPKQGPQPLIAEAA